MMKIAILGTGPVGKALGDVLGDAGHGIIYGTRSNGEKDRPDSDRVVGYGDAVLGADAVLLAVPYDAAEDVIRAAGDLDSKILIDCTNAVGGGDEGPEIALPPGTSAGEEIAGWAPDARVYKTFNQVGVEVLGGAASFGDDRPFMLIAGPDGDGREAVETIVRDTGFDPQYFGSIAQSHLLEAFAMIWIHLAGTERTGRDWALVRRKMT